MGHGGLKRGHESRFQAWTREFIDDVGHLWGRCRLPADPSVSGRGSGPVEPVRVRPDGHFLFTGTHDPSPEKLTEYECGFPAFEGSRAQFDVRFYLVAILFIIFDLEAAFLFPWAVSLDDTGWAGWTGMMIFLAELALGLVYAWKKGALEWE